MFDELGIKEIRDKLLRKEVSVVEIVNFYLDRIRTLNSKINAFLTISEEEALEEASRLDQDFERLKMNPLGGVPVAIKDCLCTRGIRTTCGSKILQNFIPPYDATCVLRLKEAGAIIVGKTNMDEFAMGSSTEHSAYGPTRNPWDQTRVPGGSSGGSAASVASCMVPVALGTDTGGSIRQPASFCGVVGLKPTYGRVSRYGLVAFASSLDQVGPMGKTVDDVASVLKVIAGWDFRDTTSVPVDVPDYNSALNGAVSGLTLGIPKEYFKHKIDSEIQSALDEALKVFERLGVNVVDVSLPHTDYGVAAYYIIAPAEASSNLERYDGVKYGYRAKLDRYDLKEMYMVTRAEGFGAEVKRRIMLGTYVLSAGYYDAYYRKASQVRRLIKEDFERAFEKCDALITPVIPTPPFVIGEKVDDPLEMYLNDIFTLPASLAGVPGISVPFRFTSQGLPVGFQLIGSYFNEPVLLKLASAFHREIGYKPRVPM